MLRLFSAYADRPSNEGKVVRPCSLNAEMTMSIDETLSYGVFAPTCREGSATTAIPFRGSV
jgi:hypothetical protein